MSHMFMNGQPVSALSGDVTEIRNPATGELVDSAPKGSALDVRAAIDSAYTAREAWREVDPAKRGALLAIAAHTVNAHFQELAMLLTREQGKPYTESVREVRRFTDTLEYYAGLGKNLRGGYVPLDKGAHGLIMKMP